MTGIDVEGIIWTCLLGGSLFVLSFFVGRPLRDIASLLVERLKLTNEERRANLAVDPELAAAHSARQQALFAADAAEHQCRQAKAEADAYVAQSTHADEIRYRQQELETQAATDSALAIETAREDRRLDRVMTDRDALLGRYNVYLSNCDNSSRESDREFLLGLDAFIQTLHSHGLVYEELTDLPTEPVLAQS